MHAVLEEGQGGIDVTAQGQRQAQERGGNGPPHVEMLLAAGVQARLEQLARAIEMAPPEPHEPGQRARDGLAIHVSSRIGRAHGLVRARIRGVEIPELGQSEGQPPARGDVRDRRLGAGVGRARALERVDILPQDEFRAPVLALGVAAVAEIAAGQRLQSQILRGVRDAQAALAVVDGQVRLALQVVVVHEIAIHARQARLVAQLGPELLGFFRQLENLGQASELQEGRT